MKKILTTLFSVLFGASFAFSTLQLNEIRTDHSGFPDNDEMLEIKGTPGESLANVWFLTLGDHSSCGIDGAPEATKGSGTVEFAIPLNDLFGDPLVMPDSGFLLIVNTFFRTSENHPTAINDLIDIEVPTDNIFENSDNVTFILARDYTGPVVVTCGDQLGEDALDLDTDDDSVLDVFPWSSVIDAVSQVETPNPVPNDPEDPNFAEGIYAVELGGVNVGPDSSGFTPAHLYRGSTSGNWNIGSFFTETETSVDTPGEENPIDTLIISEVRPEQSGADDDEFFELKGSPGDPLDGITYLVLGDGDGGSGVIEEVVDLSGNSIPSSGFFVVAESTFTTGTADLTAELNFEGSDNVTHMIVFNFTGVDGDDLDTDDDGTLDVLPWAFAFDAIGIIEEEAFPPTSTEFNYGSVLGGNTIGPDGSFLPGHVYRNGATGQWLIGSFTDLTIDSPGATNPSPMLTITLQPQDATINSGESTVLTVDASGTEPFTYQWYKGDSGDESNPVADVSILDEADIFATVTYYNGNDALAIRKEEVLIDVLGVIGGDPGSSGWGSGDANTSEHTIVRKSSVTQGDPDGFLGNETDISGEWLGFPQNTIDDIGRHTADSQVSDLIISEYIEGSGIQNSNKAIEIYNGTGAAVDLSLYVVELYSNGSTDVQNTLTLSDIQPMLNDGEVLVIANDRSDGADNAFNTPTSLNMTANYWVRVTDQTESVDSDTATVTVEGGALDVFNGEPIDGFPNWRASSWYKNYNVEFWPWIFHDEHSWQFVFDGSTANGIFLFDLGLENWIFLTESTYRWEYLFSDTPGWIFTFDDNTANPYRRFFQRGDDNSIFEVTLGQ